MAQFEVWFSYRGSRRFRAASDEGQRDAAVAELGAMPEVTDVEVVAVQEPA